MVPELRCIEVNEVQEDSFENGEKSHKSECGGNKARKWISPIRKGYSFHHQDSLVEFRETLNSRPGLSSEDVLCFGKLTTSLFANSRKLMQTHNLYFEYHSCNFS